MEVCVSSSAAQRHAQADALAALGGDELVRDGGNGGLAIIRVGLDVHRFDADARLPLVERTAYAVLDQVACGDRVGLEQETPQTTAEGRQTQPLLLIGHQDHPDRIAHIRLARRPGDPTIGSDAGWKADALSQNPSGVHRYLRLVKFGKSMVYLGLGVRMGKQIFRNGIHQKMMFNRFKKIMSTSSAQMVMIGMENEQISPIFRPPPPESANSPFNNLFKSVALAICCCN